MKIMIEIKPFVFTARYKADAVSKVLRNGIPTFSNYGKYIAPYDARNEVAVVANYQVQNRKTKQKKNVKTGKTSSTIVHKKLWTVRVYRIPIDLLKAGNLVVTQKARHFEIRSKSSKA